MATLPTNYVDETLASSMNGKRHYNMTTDSKGTYFTDVSEYTQRGSTFGAAQINETNTQVNQNTTDIAGKLDKTGDSKDNTVTFTSNDTASPTSFSTINVMSSGEKHSSLMNKLSTAIRNIRFLNSYKRTTGAFNSYQDTVTFTSADVSSDSSATSWTTVSKLESGLTHATLLNRISAMMKNTRYLYNSLFPTVTQTHSVVFSSYGQYVDSSKLYIVQAIKIGNLKYISIAGQFLTSTESIYETSIGHSFEVATLTDTFKSVNNSGVYYGCPKGPECRSYWNAGNIISNLSIVHGNSLQINLFDIGLNQNTSTWNANQVGIETFIIYM